MNTTDVDMEARFPPPDYSSGYGYGGGYGFGGDREFGGSSVTNPYNAKRHAREMALARQAAYGQVVDG